MPIEDLLADFGDALRTKRIGSTRPAERGLGLLVRLKQRLLGPFRRRRRVRVDTVQAIEHNPGTLRGGNHCFFYVLDRLAHNCFRLLTSGLILASITTGTTRPRLLTHLPRCYLNLCYWTLWG